MDDYKEKYKQAVKKIKDLFNEGEQKGFTIITYRKDFEKIFPELKESEDERIRKELIRVFSNREKYRIAQSFGDITVSEALTWLKKQGKETSWKPSKEEMYEWDAEKKELKKIKKNTDVGHEYFSDLLEKDDCDNIDDYAYQCAYCMSHDWMKDTATWDDVETACKLGAEWNERHHNSSWSEEDMSKVQRICKYLDEAKKYYADITEVRECIDWLKSLKGRVQPKQEWGKEDERNLQGIIDEIEANKNQAPGYDLATYDRFLSWLKSLKDRYI